MEIACRTAASPDITARILRLSYRIHEVPIRYYARSREKGKKLTWRDGLQAILTLLGLRLASDRRLFGIAHDRGYHRQRQEELARPHPLAPTWPPSAGCRVGPASLAIRSSASSRLSPSMRTIAGAAAATQASRAVQLFDVVIVGGCGHVGLPLALSLADAGRRVGIYDIDSDTMERVRSGEMPFMEHGADELLSRILPTDRLVMTDDAAVLGRTDVVILVIGTPIDEFMKPSTRLFERVVDELSPHLRDGSLLILRSTVYPGTTEYVEQRLQALGKQADVAFCPERIAEGHALEEIRSLPQIIGTSSDRAFQRASEMFGRLQVEIVRTEAKEAEIAKLFTNTWRYMKFAIANQFFQMAHSAGLDYNQVLQAIRHNYPRASDLPSPGFAAGPCLLKDTMQLAAFSPDHFPMGHAAMLINEGLPNYLVDVMDKRVGLRGRTLGILGMAFKGESDDSRTSLSYKLRKLAAFRGATVLCSDPYVRDSRLVPQDELLERSDIVVIGAPHRAYRGLDMSGRHLVDIWGITNQGIVL